MTLPSRLPARLSFVRVDDRWFAVVNCRNDFCDQPLHGLDRFSLVEVPRAYQPLIGRRTPQHVEQTGQRAALSVWQVRRAGDNRSIQGLVSSAVGADEGRSVRCAEGVLDRKPSQRCEDSGGYLGEVVQLDVLVGNAGLVFQPAHDRVVQMAFGRKVAIYRALADLGTFSDGAKRQFVPVPGGEFADES